MYLKARVHWVPHPEGSGREPSQPSQATEPTELVETSTVTEESPVQDDSPSGEVPVKVAE